MLGRAGQNEAGSWRVWELYLRRAQELLELIELAELGGRYPAQLSGGQKQRVAVARALACNPKVRAGAIAAAAQCEGGGRAGLCPVACLTAVRSRRQPRSRDLQRAEGPAAARADLRTSAAPCWQQPCASGHPPTRLPLPLPPPQ